MLPLMLLLAAQPSFPLHAFHKTEFGGNLACGLCHVAVSRGSVTLKRPGHEQCMVCHAADFKQNRNRKLCEQCHSSFPPASAADLIPFPRYKGVRSILLDFSHRKHLDSKSRVDPQTGFRADCAFCHKFDADGRFANFPQHEQCAACHAKPGMKPSLTGGLNAQGCRGCHDPEAIESSAAPETHASGKYPGIVFSHAPHLNAKDRFDMQCTTCHYAIPLSAGIADLELPKMADCAGCHDSARAVTAKYRTSQCSVCHEDNVQTLNNHVYYVKPASHTESFRARHADEAAAPDAKCFACHQNVTASRGAKFQCDNCHAVMKPRDHTSRWKDDLHGEYVALDRARCATCHTASYCSDCHNELPRSHNPLPVFAGGAHAFPAKLDLRGCFTCHTFQNTCSRCHVNRIVP